MLGGLVIGVRAGLEAAIGNGFVLFLLRVAAAGLSLRLAPLTAR
jgi:hypothetical protein